MRRSPLFVSAAVAVTVSLGACANSQSASPGATSAAPPASAAPSISSTSSSPAAEPTSAPATRASKTKSTGGTSATSDVSQLKRAGIDLGAGALIDVADDGADRFLQVGKNGVVDFTGTAKTDSTMMSLQAAPVRASNRVVIKPPFWNEDLGDGQCVADTAGAPLKLETCEAGKASQIWRVALAGDSGQFELHGAYGVIRVDEGRITGDGTGRTGLQVLPYAS